MIRNILADTELKPVAGSPSRYVGEIADAWSVFSAYGGVVMIVANRAAQLAVDRPNLDLLYTSANFCAPVPCGPIEVETSALANAKNAAHATATIFSKGDAKPKVHVTSAFGRRAASPYHLTEAKYPEGLLPVTDAFAFDPSDSPLGGAPIMQQLDVRWAHEYCTRPGRKHIGEPLPPEPAVLSCWMRFKRSPYRTDSTIDPVTYAVAADALGSALFRGLGATTLPFFPVTVAMDLHIFGTTQSEWLLQHCRVWRLADGYASGTIELWDEEKNLVAASTQIRFCKPFG